MPSGICCWTSGGGCCLWKVVGPPDNLYNIDGSTQILIGTVDTIDMNINGTDTTIVLEVR